MGSDATGNADCSGRVAQYYPSLLPADRFIDTLP
jgi:hypothetical protein